MFHHCLRCNDYIEDDEDYCLKCDLEISIDNESFDDELEYDYVLRDVDKLDLKDVDIKLLE